MITVDRYHDFSFGHRVLGLGKCEQLHGHNARVTFKVQIYNERKLVDGQIDFEFKHLKQGLCQWLEDNWDHKMLLWEDDPIVPALKELVPGVVALPFHPSTEAMASFLLRLGPQYIPHDQGQLVSVHFEETRKCGVTATLHGY